MTSPASGDRRLKVLIADDEDDVRLGLRLLITSLGAEVKEAASGAKALEILERWTPHLLLADLAMGEVSGMDLLHQVRQQQPNIRVLILTGFGTIPLAVEALKKGAANFLTKPFDNRELLAEIDLQGRRALMEEQIRRPPGPGGEGRMIAEDPAMAGVLELIRRAAPATMPVLIYGESGTGKELVARAIHQGGRNPQAPFLPVNAAALPDTLLEAELFGHMKGAFTGAGDSREGVFAQARGGTVFLDEVALMSPAFQGKLLRVLQEHAVTPLGSSAPKPVDFRLVAATNRSLSALIAAGKFRQDLYYRLKVVSLNLPPLRERPADIEPLVLHFIGRHATGAGLAAGRFPHLSPEALEALRRHSWPGNVRELENCIQRALILCHGEEIRPLHLGLDEESLPWQQETASELSYEDGKQRVLDAYRRRTLERALKASEGNVSQAAELCGLTRAAFQRIMRSLDLDRQEYVRT